MLYGEEQFILPLEQFRRNGNNNLGFTVVIQPQAAEERIVQGRRNERSHSVQIGRMSNEEVNLRTRGRNSCAFDLEGNRFVARSSGKPEGPCEIRQITEWNLVLASVWPSAFLRLGANRGKQDRAERHQQPKSHLSILLR